MTAQQHDSLSRKIDCCCPPEPYAAPRLKHGCAELASAQHTVLAKRAFIPPMVLRSVEILLRKTQAWVSICICPVRLL